jgi:hypothetical protein
VTRRRPKLALTATHVSGGVAPAVRRHPCAGDRGATAVVPGEGRGRRARAGRGAGDHRAPPQELPGPVLHRDRHAASRPLHGEGRADEGPARRFLLRLGAFTVHRGAADAEAMQTARAILTGGGLVVVFPRGSAPDRRGPRRARRRGRAAGQATLAGSSPNPVARRSGAAPAATAKGAGSTARAPALKALITARRRAANYGSSGLCSPLR